VQSQVKPTSLKSFVGKTKWLQAAIVVFPIGAKILGAKPAYLTPPLGTLGDYVIPLAFLLVGLFAVIPWFIKERTWAAVAAVTSLTLCIVSIIWYSILVSNYVVRVDLPSGKVIRVSVGTELTEPARELFPAETPIAMMVKDKGFSEEDIHFLWTEPSILKVRGEMLASYIGFLAMCNLFVGAVAKASDLEQPD
jgi:hypothetical protein